MGFGLILHVAKDKELFYHKIIIFRKEKYNVKKDFLLLKQ